MKSLHTRVVRFDAVWPQLREDLYKTMRLESTSAKNIVSTVYSLCVAQPRPLSEQLYREIEKLAAARCAEVVAELQAQQGQILALYGARWDVYAMGSLFLDHFCNYVNRYWVKKKREETKRMVAHRAAGGAVHEIKTVALLAWRDGVLLRVHDKLWQDSLAVIATRRAGEVADVARIRLFTESLVAIDEESQRRLESYERFFEQPFLADAVEHARRQASNLIATENVLTYLRRALAEIDREVDLARQFVDRGTVGKLQAELNKIWVQYGQDGVREHLPGLLAEERTGDLHNVYVLFSRQVDGLSWITQEFQRLVAQGGTKLLEPFGKDSRDSKAFADVLVGHYFKYLQLVQRSFDGSQAFLVALDKGMTATLRSCGRSAELLAKYCDLVLRKGSKATDESNAEEVYDNIITVFRYLDDKDVFQKFYARSLCRRLINDASDSEDAEASFLGRLKAVCGYEFTSKLQRMFADMDVSVALNQDYTRHVEQNMTDLGLDFSVRVLTANSWPISPPTHTMTPPLVLARCIEHFSAFYAHRHQSRKLAWLYGMSRADVRALCFARRYEFSVTTNQLALLLLFNESERVTLATAAAQTALEEPELARNMQSLVAAGLVAKADDDSFAVNMQYTSKRLKVRLLGAVQADTGEDIAKARHDVDKERRFLVQATIVRVLKSRRKVTHTELVQQVIAMMQSRFRASVNVIKHCVEQLIEKGYMERADGEPNVYLYIA